jgi:hypothetical protein
MLKFKQILSGLGLVGIGGFSLKTLLGLKDAEVIDLDIGSIMLKAAGIGLTVSGGFDFITAVADAINNGGMSEQGDIASAIGLVKVGAGASLITSNPIPIAIALVAQFGFTGKYVGDLLGELKKNVNAPIEQWVNGFDSWVDSLNLPPILAALFKANPVSSITKWIGTLTEGVSGFVEGFTGALYNLFHGNWQGFWESGKQMWLGEMEIILSPVLTIFKDLKIIFQGVVNTFIDGINHLIDGLNMVPFINIDKLDHVDWTSKASSLPSQQYIGPTLSGRTVDEELSYTMNGVPGELVDSGMGNANNSQNVNIYLDGKQIYNAVLKAQVSKGFRMVEAGLTY